MTTMNISLPEALKTFVDDQDRLRLRGLLLDGASSAPTSPADPAYFDGLRRRARGPATG